MKDKFEIKNFLDQRYRSNKDFQRWFNKYTLAALVDGVILGALVGLFIADNPYKQVKLDSPNALQTTLEVKAVEVTTQRYCDSPIDYIRCSGEDLGKSNKEISIMINIAKKESNMNQLAKNKSSSASGLFQIISGTWYSNDCVGDKWNFKDNTDCAWKIQTKRGFQPWEVCTLGLVNCK